MKIKKTVKRIIIYFLLVMLASILQTCVFPLLNFLWIAPNLLLIVTFSYGLIYGPTTGIICGMFAGLNMDMFYPEPIGLFILIYSYLGFFSGLFKEDFRTDSFTLPLAVCFACDLMYSMVLFVYRYFMAGSADIAFTLTKIVLPEMFFTLLLTLIVYRVLLVINRRLDKIDDLRGQNAA